MPQIFTDEFDYLTRDDFVRGILVNEEVKVHTEDLPLRLRMWYFNGCCCHRNMCNPFAGNTASEIKVSISTGKLENERSFPVKENLPERRGKFQKFSISWKIRSENSRIILCNKSKNSCFRTQF